MGNNKKLQEIISESFDEIRSKSSSIKNNAFSKHYLAAKNYNDNLDFPNAIIEYTKAIGIHNDETITKELINSLRGFLGTLEDITERGKTISRIIQLQESRTSYWPTEDNYINYINFLLHVQKSNKGVNLIDKVIIIGEEGTKKHPNSKNMYATMYHAYKIQEDFLNAYISMCKVCELSTSDFSFISSNFGQEVFSSMPGASKSIRPIEVLWKNYEKHLKNDPVFLENLVEFEQKYNESGSDHRIYILWRLTELDCNHEYLFKELIPREIELSPSHLNELEDLQEVVMNLIIKSDLTPEDTNHNTNPVLPKRRRRKVIPKYEQAKIKLPHLNENLDENELNPRKIKAELDRFVIGQDYAKRIISNALYNHYKRIQTKNPEWKKKNILLIGPTGCGKTFLASKMPIILNVPYVTGDCSTMTEEGYIGGKVFDMLKELYCDARDMGDKPDYGIIYLDEVDKIAVASDGFGRDVRGRGVQQPLLKMVEGNKYKVNIGTHIKEEIVDVDTNNILFVAGGSFAGDSGKNGIYDIINNRLSNKGVVGFMQPAEDGKIKIYTPLNEDLKQFGLIPELIGRFSARSFLDELSENQLADILLNPEEALFKQEQALFKSDGIDLRIEDKAVKLIAAEAKKSKMGARGLNDILSRITADAEYELPGSGEKEFVITEPLVKKKLKG